MTSILYIVPIFLCATLWMCFLVVVIAPSADKDNQTLLRFPKSFSDLKGLSEVLKSFCDLHPKYTILLFSSAYLYKQAFIIPGSALLNVLGGALFGLWRALPLCCLLTGIGATCSYLLSKTFAVQKVRQMWPTEIDHLKEMVHRNEHQLAYYLLSLRLFPVSPNWLINLISPILDIPLRTFFFTAFFGLLPYNYICVQAGAFLVNISSLEEVFSWKIMVQLSFLSLVAFIPTKIIKRRILV